jgi:hypothetical protein
LLQRLFNSAFASRHGQFIKDLLDDRFAGFHPGPGFVSDGKNALKIAQPFMAGVLAHGHPKVPSGTKEMVCRPWRDLKIGLPVFPAINGWAIFVDRIEQFFRASAFIPIFPSRGG